MHLYQQIYEFAASAGAFEGYVYQKPIADLDMKALLNWANNLVTAFNHLAIEVRREFQSSCDQTLGRAIRSVLPVLGPEHEVVVKLKSMVVGALPESPDDFKKDKWFEE
jgi:hypothetical protein